MLKKLFDRIKYLENEIENIKKTNEIVAKNIAEIFKECKIEKDKKEKIKNELARNLSALKNIKIKKSFENGVLSFSKFMDLLSDAKDVYIIAVKLTDDELQNKYLYSYFTKNFNELFTIYKGVLIGVIEKKDLEKIKKLNSIPFFNPQNEEITDIELFKIVFKVNSIDISAMHKLLEKFKELSNRPSFKNKHFIEFSLDKNRIVDFEKEELQKKKEKYAFIYEEKYPDLEIKLKQHIDNIPFVLALLERIDTEIDEIKNSRGLLNVVNRILNYIELRTKEEEIRKMVKSIRDALKR
jgi:hypothetical protein